LNVRIPTIGESIVPAASVRLASIYRRREYISLPPDYWSGAVVRHMCR
jgi:hypothetical protein